MRRLILTLLLPLLALPAMKGQRVMQWDEFVEYLSQHEEQAESGEWEDYLEELYELHQHPVDVNRATADELQGIPLLNESQIRQILQYRSSHGRMHSLGELLFLSSVSFYERQYLPLFLCLDPEAEADEAPGNPSGMFRQDTLQAWHHELLARTDIPLYHRRGYLVPNGYRGSPVYSKVTYQYEHSRHLAAGLRAERDAGEKGVDSYGAYLLLRGLPLTRSARSGEAGALLQTLALGDYRVAFGQGLVLNQGFLIGKNFYTSRVPQGFRPQKGTDETNFMRGVATSFRLHDVTLSLFYSHRNWDATLNAPSAGAEAAPSTVRTIVTTGYHRTETEHARKGNLGVDVLGGNLSWRHGRCHLGTTGYYLLTDRELVPGTTAYRSIYPRGSRFGALGLDYGYDAYRVRFFGETAVRPDAEGSGLATLNGASWRVSPRYSLTGLQRYYSYRYYSLFGSAFSEVGSVQNETGGMLRLDAQPLDGVKLSAYADLFYNPWPRYGLKQSSWGWDAMVDGECVLTRSHSLSARYNVKRKEQSSGTALHHRLRLQWGMTSRSRQWNVSAQALLHALKGSLGEALGLTARYHDDRSPWQFSASGLYFHTSDYDSRVYMYEQNVTGMMSIPSFYGHGVHGSGLVRYRFWHGRMRAELRYGVTRYFDRSTQGSSLQTIFSPVKNDVTLQLGLQL